MKTLEAAKTHLTNLVAQDICETGSTVEGHEAVNNASRRIVEAMHAQNGKCWLGRINLYKSDPNRIILWEYNPEELVHNFSCSIVVPTDDELLKQLILDRFNDIYEGTAKDGVWIDKIFARLEEIGGIHLTWC